MTAADWPSVTQIWAEGIATGQATFEETPPSWAEFDASRRKDLRLVTLTSDGVLAGWAAASPTSSRPVYRGVVEHSIYLAGFARGQGLGHLLLKRLIDASEASGIWTIQANVFPENTASLALHEAHGFERVGIRRRIGRMTHGPRAGQWRDTLLLERRTAQP